MATQMLTKKANKNADNLSARNASARKEFDNLRESAENILNDLAFVLHLTQKVRTEMEIEAEVVGS